MANDDPNKITVNTKVTPDVQTMLGETANWITNGNISALIREMIDEWFESRKNEAELPPRIRMKIIKQARLKRQELEAELYEEYLSILENPDMSYEKSLEETARENKIEWPPKSVDLHEALPKYRSILDHLRSHNGKSTMRDLMRTFNLNKNEMTSRLANLMTANKITMDEVVYNKPTNIYLVDVPIANSGIADDEITF